MIIINETIYSVWLSVLWCKEQSSVYMDSSYIYGLNQKPLMMWVWWEIPLFIIIHVQLSHLIQQYT